MANEAFSITENAAALGLYLPPKLLEVFAQLKAGGGKVPEAPADTDEEKDKTPPTDAGTTN